MIQVQGHVSGLSIWMGNVTKVARRWFQVEKKV